MATLVCVAISIGSALWVHPPEPAYSSPAFSRTTTKSKEPSVRSGVGTPDILSGRAVADVLVESLADRWAQLPEIDVAARTEQHCVEGSQLIDPGWIDHGFRALVVLRAPWNSLTPVVPVGRTAPRTRIAASVTSTRMRYRRPG